MKTLFNTAFGKGKQTIKDDDEASPVGSEPSTELPGPKKMSDRMEEKIKNMRGNGAKTPKAKEKLKRPTDYYLNRPKLSDTPQARNISPPIDIPRGPTPNFVTYEDYRDERGHKENAVKDDATKKSASKDEWYDSDGWESVHVNPETGSRPQTPSKMRASIDEFNQLVKSGRQNKHWDEELHGAAAPTTPLTTAFAREPDRRVWDNVPPSRTAPEPPSKSPPRRDSYSPDRGTGIVRTNKFPTIQEFKRQELAKGSEYMEKTYKGSSLKGWLKPDSGTHRLFHEDGTCVENFDGEINDAPKDSSVTKKSSDRDVRSPAESNENLASSQSLAVELGSLPEIQRNAKESLEKATARGHGYGRLVDRRAPVPMPREPNDFKRKNCDSSGHGYGGPVVVRPGDEAHGLPKDLKVPIPRNDMQREHEGVKNKGFKKYGSLDKGSSALKPDSPMPPVAPGKAGETMGHHFKEDVPPYKGPISSQSPLIQPSASSNVRRRAQEFEQKHFAPAQQGYNRLVSPQSTSRSTTQSNLTKSTTSDMQREAKAKDSEKSKPSEKKDASPTGSPPGPAVLQSHWSESSTSSTQTVQEVGSDSAQEPEESVTRGEALTELKEMMAQLTDHLKNIDQIRADVGGLIDRVGDLMESLGVEQNE